MNNRFRLSPRGRAATIWLLYLAGFAPGLWGFHLGASGQIIGDPVRVFEHLLGLWALRFLCLTLAITPLRRYLGVHLIAYRRALGLLAFWYALAHFAVYLLLDRGLNLSIIADDLLRRPYLMLGMTALVLLAPLALTSNFWSIRRLGRGWIRLHMLAYPALVAAVLHYVLSLKSVTAEPVAYMVIAALLLGTRLTRLLKAGRTG